MLVVTSGKERKTAHEIANLLYGDDGLRMNIYRFNVGGGYEKDNLRIENPWRYIESFMNKDGSFDYSKDKYAVNMMKNAYRSEILTRSYFLPILRILPKR